MKLILIQLFVMKLPAVSLQNLLPKIFDDILKTLSKVICHLLNLKVIFMLRRAFIHEYQVTFHTKVQK